MNVRILVIAEAVIVLIHMVGTIASVLLVIKVDTQTEPV